MPVKATTHIHLNLSGDVSADFVYTLENPAAAGITHLQSIPGLDWYPIFNPLPIDGVVLSGLIVVPPIDNIYVYNLVTDDFAGGINQSSVVFHPSAPSVFSIRDIILPLKLSHSAPSAAIKVTFRFIWF